MGMTSGQLDAQASARFQAGVRKARQWESSCWAVNRFWESVPPRA